MTRSEHRALRADLGRRLDTLSQKIDQYGTHLSEHIDTWSEKIDRHGRPEPAHRYVARRSDGRTDALSEKVDAQNARIDVLVLDVGEIKADLAVLKSIPGA